MWDAKSLYDALETIEVTATRQWLDHGFIYKGWVNSDRQMADGLTKPQATFRLLETMSAGKWRIVWGPMFQSARKLKLAERSEGKRDFDGHFGLPSDTSCYSLTIYDRLQS